MIKVPPADRKMCARQKYNMGFIFLTVLYVPTEMYANENKEVFHVNLDSVFDWCSLLIRQSL